MTIRGVDNLKVEHHFDRQKTIEWLHTTPLSLSASYDRIISIELSQADIEALKGGVFLALTLRGTALLISLGSQEAAFEGVDTQVKSGPVDAQSVTRFGSAPDFEVERE